METDIKVETQSSLVRRNKTVYIVISQNMQNVLFFSNVPVSKKPTQLQSLGIWHRPLLMVHQTLADPLFLVPLYRRAGETVEDFKENNGHDSLWVELQLITPLLPLDKLSDV